MPQNDTYRNPGAAATSALFDFLADREAKQRQAALDDITRSTAARQDEMARANLELQREQMTGLREQREAAADVNRQKKALGVIGMLAPGAAVDGDTSRVIREGGFGPLLQAPGVVAGMPSEADAAVADEVDSALLAADPTALRTEDTFRGTPQQMALQQFLADPNTPDAVKRFMAARVAAGDESIPYQLFQDPEVSGDVNWQRFEGRRTPTSNPEFFQQHPRSGEVRDMQGNPIAGVVPVQGSAPITAAQSSRIERRVQQFDNSAPAKDASELVGHWARVADIDPNAGGAEGAAQDAMLIYTYAKAMDPASAVREGEYDTVQAWATNRKDSLILNAMRILETSPMLTADARRAIQDRIGQATNAAVRRYNNELPKLEGDLGRIYGPFPAETWRERMDMPYERRQASTPAPSTSGRRSAPATALPSSPSGVRRYNPATGRIE